jgi:hypothetical protein
MDSSTAEGFIPEDSVSRRWSLLERIGFRFAFCYFGGFCIFSGNATIWQAIPYFGRTIETVLSSALALPAEYLAGHLFHVAPPGDRLHPTGSGDTAIIWISVLLLAAPALPDARCVAALPDPADAGRWDGDLWALESNSNADEPALDLGAE